ncbi:MAG: HD domain-containing protein [Alloprevotella sp.]|nr:HD domain-containing protein [Alloprevotella sp.]MBR1651798.1 HD domain-containing protein [Alloprevotella sp.]MBR1653140.1 HD domain-containing protein [Alloprevotella sp.]
MRLIDTYYPADTPLRRLLLLHSGQVCEKALDVCRRHPELALDEDLVRAGAMVHDIGIVRCHAPGIGCEGTLPYLLHGIAGGEMVREAAARGDWQEAFAPEVLARFCERHTGTGLVAENFRLRGIPAPALLEGDPRALCPETEEERVVCYADKFFSKSHPERTRTVEQTARSLEGFGMEGVRLFLEWAERYE